MVKFAMEDPYLQKPLERRQIIEASDKAALKMAEMLGQDANYHAEGAPQGQHAAIPFSKEKEKPSEIRLFLSNKETRAEDQRLHDDCEHQDDDGDEPDDMYLEPYRPDLVEEELITDILERKLAYLYMSFQPQDPVEGPADTLFIVRQSSKNDARALIRAHSKVLKKSSDAFNELIGYKSPMVPTPANDEEAAETGMQISWKTNDIYTPSRKSMYMKILDDNAYIRRQKYEHAQRSYGQRQSLDLPPDDISEQRAASFSHFDDDGQYLSTAKPMFYEEEHEMDFEVKKRSKAERTRQESSFAHSSIQEVKTDKPQGVRRSSLGLKNVIGNLEDSAKPSLVKDFLEASSKLVQFPGLEHLPVDLKAPFETFANCINNYKNPTNEAFDEMRTQTEVDGKSLESAFLGMVGREQGSMINILENINKGFEERKKSKILLEEIRQKELEGTPGNDVSATVPRTRLERRRSQAYLESEARKARMTPMEKRKSFLLKTNQDKRISPSFLERRQSRANLELERRNSEHQQAVEEMHLRRRHSKAAIAALQRRKRLSAFESKRIEELDFLGEYDGGKSGVIEKYAPDIRADLKIPGKSFVARRKASRILQSTTGAKDQQDRAKDDIYLPKSRTLGKEGHGNEDLQQDERMDCSPIASSPPLLHTRDEDKDDVTRFFEEENIDIYASSESSEPEPAPPPLPADVEFVIEKPHWTKDVLCAILEFLYTEVVHIHCVEVPQVYRCANEILLSSLTDAIRLKPMHQYYRLAMLDDDNRKALLDLSEQLTTSADFQNYVNKTEDYFNLKKLCEEFEHEGKLELKPYKLLFETGHVAFQNIPYVSQGLHTVGGEMVLILKDPREGTRLFEQHAEENEYLTFRMKPSDRKSEPPVEKRLWLGQWPQIEKTRNRDKAWKIYLFGFPKVQRDIPLKNYIFYKHITAVSCRPAATEEFSIRIVCGILICPVLFKALHLSFPQLNVVAGRGAGYYLGGETHGNNITLTGDPLYLLRACKAVPNHLVGRTALRVASPSERTFTRLWTSTNRFGVDLECNVMYFLKPLIQIQKMLEYWFELDMNAMFAVTYPREMVELVEPHDPF